MAAAVRVKTIERIEAGALASVIRRRRPAVVTGLLGNGPQLTLDELAEGWGECAVPVAPVVDGAVAYGSDTGVPFRDIPVADVIAGLEGPNPGMVSCRPSDYLPGLEERLPGFDPGRKAPWSRARIWVSPPRTVTPLHHEVTNNLLSQLQGPKEVTLYAPWTRWAMYPERPWSRMPHVSRVAAHKPDLKRFPLFARATPWRANLVPGDTLFIPAFWWHWVQTTKASLSYNLWFAGGAVALLARTMELYKSVRKLSL